MGKQIVTLRRSNGRVVKSMERNSKYSAKQLKEALEEKFDETYYVTIEPKQE